VPGGDVVKCLDPVSSPPFLRRPCCPPEASPFPAFHFINGLRAFSAILQPLRPPKNNNNEKQKGKKAKTKQTNSQKKIYIIIIILIQAQQWEITIKRGTYLKDGSEGLNLIPS